MTINWKRVYSILKTKQEGDSVNYLIEIDFSHPVFQGHFPAKAVLPGVMMCDIIRYQVSDLLGLKVQLSSAKNIKFSRMITPSKYNTYNVTIAIIESDGQYDVRATISQNNNPYFKINARYQAK